MNRANSVNRFAAAGMQKRVVRTFAVIVSERRYCDENSHATSCIALSNKMDNDTTDGHCYSSLPRCNDFGRPVTPIFLLMEHFLYLFSTFNEK